MESFPADDFSPGEFDLSEFHPSQERTNSQQTMQAADQGSHYAARFGNTASSMPFYNYRPGEVATGNPLAGAYNQTAVSDATAPMRKSSDSEDSFRIETFYSTQFDSGNAHMNRNLHAQQRGLTAAQPPYYPPPINFAAVSNGSAAENLSKPVQQKPQPSVLPPSQLAHSPRTTIEQESSQGTIGKPTTSLPYNNNNSDKLADASISTSMLDVETESEDDVDRGKGVDDVDGGKDTDDVEEEGLEVDEDGEVIDRDDDDAADENSIPEGHSPMFLNSEGQVEASAGFMPGVAFDSPDRQIFDRYTGQRDGPTNNLFYIELGEKPFKCVTCHTGFCQKSDLIIHSRIHSGERPYQCRTCGKQFISSGALLRHTRIHTGEKKYRCNECGHEFTQRSSLTRHTQTHTGERNFNCPDCGKSFATNSHLTVHIRSHTGERPYECHVCDKRFMASGNLTKHLQTNHGITTSHAKKQPTHLRPQTSAPKLPRNISVSGNIGAPAVPGGNVVTSAAAGNFATPTAAGTPARPQENPVALPPRPVNVNPSPRPVIPNTAMMSSTAVKNNVENLLVKPADVEGKRRDQEDLKGTKWDIPSGEESEDGSPVKPQSTGLVGGSPLTKTSVPGTKKEAAFGHAMSLVFGADGTPVTDPDKPPAKRAPDADDPFDQYITKRDEFPNSNVTPTKPTGADPTTSTPNSGDTPTDTETNLYTGERPYKCNECDRAYFSRSNLKRHVKTHFDTSLYKCEECAAVFTQKSGLIRHVRIHSGEKPFVCTVCGKAFGESGHLTKHLRIHTGTGEKPYVCRICFKSFGESSNLTRHVKTHSHIRPTPQYLQNGGICTKMPEPNAVDNFIKNALSPSDASIPDTPPGARDESNTSETLKVIRRQMCRTCRTWFPSVDDLQAHVCMPHLTAPSGVLAALALPPGSKAPPTENDAPPTGDKNQPIRDGAPPKTSDGDNDPIGDGATPTLPNAQPTEGDKAGSEGDVGEPEYKCALCQAIFPHQTELIMHASTHSGEKMYKCDPCERYFTSSSNLRRHILLHTGEKMFGCRTCDAKFSQRGSLVRHERIHTGEKPYTCNYCGKSFGTSGHLTVHTRSHTGEKPFLCKICGRSFTESGNLRKHLLKHEAGTYRGITSPMKPDSVALRLQSQNASDDSGDPMDKLFHEAISGGPNTDADAMPPPTGVPGVKMEPAELEDSGTDQPLNMVTSKSPTKRTKSSPKKTLKSPSKRKDKSPTKRRYKLPKGTDKPAAVFGDGQLVVKQEPMEVDGGYSDMEGEMGLPATSDDMTGSAIQMETTEEVDNVQDELQADNERMMAMHLPVNDPQSLPKGGTQSLLDVEPAAISDVPPPGVLSQEPSPMLPVKIEKMELIEQSPTTDIHELWMCDRCMMMNGPGVPMCVACNKERSGTEASMQLEPMLEQQPPTAAPTIRKTCPRCNTAFTSITELKKHRKTCVKPKTQPSNTIKKTCPKCNKAFTSITELKKHKKACVKPKTDTSKTVATVPQIIPPAVENVPLENKDTSYLANMVTVAAFKCDLCHLVFDLQKELNAHLHIHAGEKAFKCVTCDKFFSSKQTLKRHSQKHITECTFTCGLCNLQFVSKLRYEKHLIFHYGRRQFRCDQCGSAFDDNTRLMSHMRAHKLDPILHCLSYKLKDQLGRLQRIQMEEAIMKRLSKEERRFRMELMDRLPELDLFGTTPDGTPGAPTTEPDKPGPVEVENNRCKKCHKEFHFKDNIQEHRCGPTLTPPSLSPGSTPGAGQTVMGKSPTGPFKCGKCPRSFADPREMKLHEQSHSHKRLYKCDKCDATFYLRRSLAKHQATFHGDGSPNKQHEQGGKHHKMKLAVTGQTTPEAGKPQASDKPGKEAAALSELTCKQCYLMFNSVAELQKHRCNASDDIQSHSDGGSDTEMDVSGDIRFDMSAGGVMFDTEADGGGQTVREPGDDDIIKALQANTDATPLLLPNTIGTVSSPSMIRPPNMPGLPGMPNMPGTPVTSTVPMVPRPGFPVTPFIYTGDKPYKCVLCDKAFISRSNLKRHQKTNHYKDYLRMYNKTDITVLPRDIQPYVMPTSGPQMPTSMPQLPITLAQPGVTSSAKSGVTAGGITVGGITVGGITVGGVTVGGTPGIKTEPGVQSPPPNFTLPADEIKKLTDDALEKLQSPADSTDKPPVQDDPFGQYIGERDEFPATKLQPPNASDGGGSNSAELGTNTNATEGDNEEDKQSPGSQELLVDGATNITSYSGKKPFLCSVCLSGFNQKSDLIIHYRTHTGERPYLCNVCPKNFISQSALRKHNLIHTGERNYRCMQCGAEFTQKSSLQRHERVHSGERPYECSICGKRFAGSGTLTSHMRSHTGEKPYICDFCGKCYTESGSLNKHVVRHHPNNGATPTKPFHCEFCPKTFMENGSLGKHMKHHHPQADLPPSKKFCRRNLIEKTSVDDETGANEDEMMDIQNDGDTSGLDGDNSGLDDDNSELDGDNSGLDGGKHSGVDTDTNSGHDSDRQERSSGVDMSESVTAGHDFTSVLDRRSAHSELLVNTDQAESGGLLSIKKEHVSPVVYTKDKGLTMNDRRTVSVDPSTVIGEQYENQQLTEEQFKAKRDREYAMIFGKNMFMPPDDATPRNTKKDFVPPLSAAAFMTSSSPLPSPQTNPMNVSPHINTMDTGLSSQINPQDISPQINMHRMSPQVNTQNIPGLSKRVASPDISHLLSPHMAQSLQNYSIKREQHDAEPQQQSTPLNLATNHYMYPDHSVPPSLHSPGFLDPPLPSPGYSQHQQQQPRGLPHESQFGTPEKESLPMRSPNIDSQQSYMFQDRTLQYPVTSLPSPAPSMFDQSMYPPASQALPFMSDVQRNFAMASQYGLPGQREGAQYPFPYMPGSSQFPPSSLPYQSMFMDRNAPYDVFGQPSDKG